MRTTEVRAGDLSPMKMDWIEVEDLTEYVGDPDWVMEQKFDGVRVMARIGAGRVDFVGFGGAHVTHAASVLHFPRLREELVRQFNPDTRVVLDGELLPQLGLYVVYDMPLWITGEGWAIVVPTDPFHERRASLQGLMGLLEDVCPSVVLAPQAVTPEDKVELAKRAYREQFEGVVVKRFDGPYESGQRVRHQLKAKFVKTVDCVVTERNAGGACNARLAVYEDERLRTIGACSMIGKPPAEVGDVVEVKYLYATESLTLYQPRLMRIRVDKRPEDCRIEQLVPVNKGVIQ